MNLKELNETINYLEIEQKTINIDNSDLILTYTKIRKNLVSRLFNENRKKTIEQWNNI